MVKLSLSNLHGLTLRLIGIYTTFQHNKNNELQDLYTPSPAGEGWGEENKINKLNSPSSQPSPAGEGA